MQFNFNFEAFEKSGKDKNEAIKYLKGLNSSLDFDKLESDLKGDTEAIYNTLKGGNFSFSKPSIEDTREKLLKNKENEVLKAEFNAGLSWLDNKQDYNFYDFKKAKERANSKQGLIKQDLEAKEKELKRKEALFEKRLENENIFTKSLRDTADNLGLNAAADVLELGLNKLGFKDENYIFESEKEDIKKRALKSVREKLENNEENFSESEKYALRDKYDELDYKKALNKEKEKLRLIQKDSGFDKSEVEFMEEELGFFHTLFNDTKDTVREFKDAYKSEGIISADVQKAINVLKQFEKSELLRHAFSDKKQELQQEYLKNALVIAELNGFDDVGLSKENELYFIKKDKDKEQKYLVNTGFLDNFWDLMENSKFEIAGGIAGGIKGFNSGKSAKGKAIKSILGAAAGSFGGGLMDAKIADMYLNRESDYSRNLEYALQAGLLSLAGDGVIIAAKPMVKGAIKGAKGLYTFAKEHSALGLFSTIPSQNISAANKIIDEVFTREMKEELKQAQKEFGGGVRAQDLANPVFEKLKENFAKRYGKEDKKTKSIEKLAEIFNQNSLKTKQQEMLDLIRSDKDGSTLAYLLEVAKDDVKIQNNLKNMLNLASANVEKNLKNLNINPREIKSILDEFEAGNKAAFKEVENQIAKLYNEDIKVVLDRNAYENIKEDFLQNGVNLDEMTPFLRDLENNVFSKEGVTFSKLNNFRKNLNYYIFNKDKTPNFINTLKKIAETSLKAEIDKGIDNIFKELPKAYESIKELYSTSLKDYAAMKELNESIKNLKLQDSAKSADEVVDSLIKYAKGQGEGGENNLQKIKAYLGEENNAFLEMQILNRLFKESMVENDRAKVRVFDSESFLNRVKELVGGNELYERKLGKEFLQQLSPSPVPKQLSIDEFLNTLENFKNKENFLKHIEKDPKRKDYLNLIEPTLKEPDIAFKKLENGVEKEKFIKKFSDGKDFFYLLATKDNKETILTAFKTDRINTILKEFNADIIPTFIRQGSKGKAAGTTNESITQPLFKSKEAREFLELVEGFDKLYKNDAIIAKNFTQGTASKLSTSIATSAEGAIKQKVVKGAFDPIFRLLPDGVLFGLFSKQIQGGALRYHLKKALSRSLNYDDFKLKLERELKRTNFNSNTSRLIEKLMQNLEDFNAEKEAKLAQIREVKREEELKEDFGINFEGFKGKEAVLKLLEEKKGQVKGAFYKEGLGEIDLVWGEVKGSGKEAKGYGLSKIIEKHGEDFKEFGEDLEGVSKGLNEIITKGEIHTQEYGRKTIIYHKNGEVYKVGLKQNWKGEPTKNSWVITGYKEDREADKFIHSSDFTKGEALPLNSKQSIAQKAKSENTLPLNDEPLEVEIIEEASLNEPMKFLEFQQKKLLTYIKQNTPLRLLERKIELKTRDILNFLEQSALNGKEKAFLMRNFERDLGKIELKIKEKESVKESEKVLKSDLLDKTKPLRKAEKEELTKEVLEEAKRQNAKIWVGNLENESLADELGLDFQKGVKITMNGNALKHIENRHGVNSTLAKNGQPIVENEDYANHAKIVNEADKRKIILSEDNQKILVSGKQINGYHIIIESISTKDNELKLKTMYKENGSLENSNIFKEPVRDRISGGESLRVNPSNALDPNGSSESIAQIRPKALNLQEIEQALKARMSQINDEIFAIERVLVDKAFREKLKEASKVKPVLEALKEEWKALEPVIITWTHTDYSKFKPKKYYNRRPNLSNLWHIEETLDVYKGYARENERQAKQVKREIALLEKYVKLLKDKEAEVEAFKAKARADEDALILESRIIPFYNQLREVFKNGQHTTKQILEANNIEQDSELAKEVIDNIAKIRQYLEHTFNITPLKEFGTNYAEFYKDGKGAVEKLLAEQQGQVSGAFYKEGLGEIDLVWGDENFGLRHILERRAKQWGEQKALKFISHLSENIEKGQIVELEKGRVGIKTDLTTIILDKKENNNFVLTAFRDRNNKKELESLNLSQSKTFTSENAETNAKESPVTPLNQESIIPQRSINLAMEKFHYDEKKAVDENKLYKSLNESLKAGWDFFKANNKDDYNDKLFNNVIRVANDLDVRFWYQPNAKWMNGSYTYALNRIMLRSDFQTSSNAKTMLHELIHGVTSRAIYAYEDKIFRQKLSKEQIEGIEELKKLFKEVLDKNEAKAWKKAGNFKAEVELNEGANTLYGLRDEHEFLAELANPQFRSFLKEQNLFAQIIEAMAKIFSYVKEKLSGKVKSVSAKEELEGILYKIMDNYNNPHEFSTQMSEYFGSRNFVDIKRFKDYIKNNKEQFDKDNGKYPFKFFDNSKLSNAEKDAFKGKAEYEEVMDRNARIWREDDDLLALWLRSKDERIMPNYPNPLYEDERQILKNHKEQSYLKDLKNAVENYYKVNYDEFNNAFNGAFKDKHFFKAKKGDEKRDKRGGFIYNASDDVKFLLALKPYFESGLYKILDENDFKRIEENIIRILKEEHLKYRNKPLNEWLAKAWVEKDVANLLEAKASPFTQKQELENKEANVHTLREQTKELLSALVGKNITNQNDGRIASISRKNIMKMTSDKAIQKSVNNGFTPQEHFKAVQDIESLYQAAVLKETHADRKSNNPNVFIHRYTADFNGNNALITIKESLDNNSKGNKIYTLELEALELKPSAPEPQGSVTMSKNTGYAEPVTPNETHKSIIAQKNENIPHSNPHLGAGLVGGSLGSKAVSMGFKHLEKNPALKEKIITELADTLAQGFDKAREKYPLLSLLEPRYIVQNERGRKIQAKVMLKELEKEQKGLYNVAYNGKNASLIKQDLASVESAIALMQGTRYKGAKHERIKHLTDPSKEGYVTDLEFVSLGKSIREFLKHYEPFIDTNGARLYEWEKEGVRFRVVVNDVADMDSNPTTATEEIITFYSDRNLKEAMNFKNPVLKETIIDVKKMQKAREQEHFYSTFGLQDVLDDTFIKRNNIKNNYYGSIRIGPKLKEREYHILSNQLYLNKVDFNKNKISDEAIRDFLKSLRLLENNNNELWEAQNIAYKHNIPLSRAKKVMQEQKRYQKEIPLFKEASERFKEFEPRKIKNLLEWHKDSHPLTKDENGLPKVFYHGSTSGKKITEFDRQFDKSGWGFWFSPIRAVSAGFAKYRKPQAVFLKLEKPFDMTKGVDFDLMLKEQLFFGKEQIEELKPEFKKIQKIYKGLLQDLDKQGIKPIEFFHDGSFYGIRNNKMGFFNTEAGEMGGLKGAGLTHKIQALPLTQNYKAFKEWQDKHNIIGGIRNEYDLLFRLTKQGDYYNNQVQSDLGVRGYDGIKVSENEFTIFDSSQAKAVDNKGAYSDGYDVWDKPSKKEIKENELEHKYFNESSPNIYYSNPHLGAGLVGGSLNGVEQDEEGNLSFNHKKFAMGFLGGAIGSKAVSSAYKAKYYEKNFNKFIDEVNAKKEQIKPRFILTQELEKAYRENELKIKQSAAEKLNLKGKIFADYIKLAQKHPEYFANPQEAKELSEFIAQNASVGIKASKKEYELIFAEIQGTKGVFALDLEYKGGKHRIRSVYLMKNMQYKKKLFEAKKLGEPILQF